MLAMTTNRLVIRNFVERDWKDLYEYLSIQEVLKYEPEDANTEEECILKSTERSKQDIFLAVCLRSKDKMIGHLYFSQKEPWEFMTWELGYIFNPEFYGKGYATEACSRVLQYGFEELGAHRIMAMCNPENAASWKLLERLDMRREGHFKKQAFFRKNHDGIPLWQDAFCYAMLSEEWGTK